MEDVRVEGQVLRESLINPDHIIFSLEVLQDKQNAKKFD